MSSPPPSGDYPTAPIPAPWPEFFSVHSLSLPVSLSDATTRLNSNLSHFRVNYINIFLIIFFLTLALRPLSLLLIFATTVAWYYLYFNPPSSPLEVLGFIVDDRILTGVLSLITVTVLFVAHAWLNLVVAVVISAAVVGLHGVLRAPSGDHDPYGGLLDAESGAYNEF